MFNLQFDGLIIHLLEEYRQKELNRLSLIQSKIQEGNELHETYAKMIERVKNSDHESLVTRTIIDATTWASERTICFENENR